jgi:alpha-L-fucosidase
MVKTFGALKVDWHYDEIYKMIHDLQPQALIGNNHHIGVIDGEDFQMFEKDLPGKNTTGWGTAADKIGSVPLEVCETINGSWGFNLQDRKHKSDKELIHYLIKAAGYGSNMLLNVGPMPNGKNSAGTSGVSSCDGSLAKTKWNYHIWNTERTHSSK